jgi:hypothetical protein
MVGTTLKKVTGVQRAGGEDWLDINGLASLSQTVCGLNGNRNSIDAPAKRGASKAFITP